MIRTLSFLCLWLSISSVVLADETVRQVQEELRKRNLYFGNIDGQTSPALVDALKRYQTRKGFPVTGNVDADTATSLHIQATAVAATATLPDMPVLKSDIERVVRVTGRFTKRRRDA
jgi:peptidoglycan hydrolase-like protein with peptidoglycan-binding domain